MMFVITDWHRKNPNYWCAIDRDTHDLICADIDVSKLAELVDETKLNEEVVFCRNWGRPMPFRDMSKKEIQKHRLFLKEHRDKDYLVRFDRKMSQPVMNFDDRGKAHKCKKPCKDYIFGGCGKCPSECHQPPEY